MLVIIDKYVPFVTGVLEAQGVEVQYLDPADITATAVRDADALIIRTRARCGAALLDGSRVRFIATATIGYDHIDRDYCAAHNIRWVSCPGCNAQAVCDYVEEAIRTVIPAMNSTTIQDSSRQSTDSQPTAERQLSDGKSRLTLGVVGVGHVGSLVAKMAEQHGLRVLLNDPPLGIGVSLQEIAHQCDIITFHTPLTRAGEYPTYHLCDEAFLTQCRPDALIINAARGGVVDEQALIHSQHPCVIDTWEGEPQLNPDLLAKAYLASFHIAGYSIQGKINASNTCLSELCQFFGLPACEIDKKLVPLHGDSDRGWLSRVSDTLKSHPQDFEYLRESYRLR